MNLYNACYDLKVSIRTCICWIYIMRFMIYKFYVVFGLNFCSAEKEKILFFHFFLWMHIYPREIFFLKKKLRKGKSVFQLSLYIYIFGNADLNYTVDYSIQRRHGWWWLRGCYKHWYIHGGDRSYAEKIPRSFTVEVYPTIFHFSFFFWFWYKLEICDYIMCHYKIPNGKGVIKNLKM